MYISKNQLETLIPYKKSIIPPPQQHLTLYPFSLFFFISFFFVSFSFSIKKMLVKLTLFSAITLVSYALPTRNHGALLSRSTSTSNAPLPFQSPSFLPPFKFNGAKPMSPVPTGPITEKCSLDTSSYPEPWEEPDVNHPEVQRAIKAIDWSYVPNFSPRYEGMAYDEHVDDACWWSKSLCTKPKAKYLPSDVEFCRNEGDFGLVRYINVQIFIVIVLNVIHYRHMMMDL